MTGDDETLDTSCAALFVTAGAPRTGAALGPGVAPGQLFYLVLVDGDDNGVEFAASGVSRVAGKSSASISETAAVLFIWSGSLWYVTSPGSSEKADKKADK